jgi:hypothetical protein
MRQVAQAQPTRVPVGDRNELQNRVAAHTIKAGLENYRSFTIITISNKKILAFVSIVKNELKSTNLPLNTRKSPQKQFGLEFGLRTSKGLVLNAAWYITDLRERTQAMH